MNVGFKSRSLVHPWVWPGPGRAPLEQVGRARDLGRVRTGPGLAQDGSWSRPGLAGHGLARTGLGRSRVNSWAWPHLLLPSRSTIQNTACKRSRTGFLAREHGRGRGVRDPRPGHCRGDLARVPAPRVPGRSDLPVPASASSCAGTGTRCQIRAGAASGGQGVLRPAGTVTSVQASGSTFTDPSARATRSRPRHDRDPGGPRPRS